MASTVHRRPLPAVIALLALLLLTALVWWRVLHRGDASTQHKAAPCPTRTAAAGTLPAPGSVTLQILNATSRRGIAAKARTALMNDGFKIPAAATNDSAKKFNKVGQSAEVRFGPAGKLSATLVRYYFPGAAMVATTSKTTTVVVSLGKKYRSVASANAVRTALTKAHLTAASPTPTPTSSPSC